MKKYIYLISILAISACNNKQIYESISAGEKHKCASQLEMPYEECIQQFNKSYNEYKNERKEVKGN